MLKLVLKIGLLVVLALGVGAAVLFFTAPDRYNLLVIGSDQRGTERARSDVLFVFSLPKDPRKRAAIITIPRDSRVEIPEHGQDKITHAYAYGEREEGSLLGNRALTKQVVEQTLGIHTDATIEVTFQSFVGVVDALGGVDVEGAGHLDGEAALLQVRNRYRPGGDFARSADQREVFHGLLGKLKQWPNLQAVWQLSQTDPQIRVDLPRARLMHFGFAYVLARLGQLKLGDVYDEALPGKGEMLYAPAFKQNLYFWILDTKRTEDIAKEYLR